MHIVHLAAEFSPLAKVGGLGDVTAGLPKAQLDAGETVEVILPFYDLIEHKKLQKLRIEHEKLFSYESTGEGLNTIWRAEYEGVPLILIEPQDKKRYFKRGTIYGSEDDLFRFTYFTKVALDYLLQTGKHPNILHLHDWLTAFAAPLYYEVYRSKGLKIGGIVTTIHNMLHQGVFWADELKRLGLDPELFVRNRKMQHHQEPHQLNLLKGGISYSDFLTTVSPTYAKEIQGKEGYGLSHLLEEKSSKLRGILNGIDTSYWNPATDPYLAKNYPANGQNIPKILPAKKANKKVLAKKLRLAESSAPLFVSITRLVEQKGPSLIRFGLEYVLEKGGQFLLLGSTPEPRVKEEFLYLAEKYRDNPHVHFHFLFDEELAHLAYAAADFILIPSLFEPCGLTQMIALRYGTIPIVTKVGGLSDTVFDIDHEGISLEKRNGYTCDFPSNDSLRWSIDRAFGDYEHASQKWHLMLKNGLSADWSWKNPTQEYLKIYRWLQKKS